MSTATNSSSSSSSSETQVVQELYSEDTSNSNDVLIGYACQQVLTQNVVNDFEVLFFMDLATRVGEQPFTVQHLQQGLVDQMGQRYGISDGLRCSELPVDGSTWVVQFTIEPSDFEAVDIFDGCRQLTWNTSTQACQFYKVTVRGSYVGAPTEDFTDIVTFLQQEFDSTTLVQDLNDAAVESGIDVVNGNSTLYQTAFLGVPVPDDTVAGNGSDGRDNLSDPTNIETSSTTSPAQTNDRTTITIVGGLLVAAFAFAFFGVMYILWRRRQYYIQSQQVHTAGLDKLSVLGGGGGDDDDVDGRRGGGGGSASVADRGLGDLVPYNTSNTDLDEEEGHQYDDDYDREHRMMMQQDSRQQQDDQKDDIDDDSQDSGSRSPNANPMQFDLGNSFKDQLMGVYGGGGGAGGGGSSVSHRGNGLTGSVLFPAVYSVDGDSDADSWAQTDGTIGSLELQLEPITAEV